ncbi:MAG: hypothetical protein U0350_17935 [Caldilineaceae bacterium]
MHPHFIKGSAHLPNQQPAPDRQETDFVSALYAGEPAAWATVVEQWSPRLYNYLVYNAIGEAEVQKLMRIIFSELVRTIAGTRRITNLTVLILSIAHRHALHYRRQSPLIMPPKLRKIALASDADDDRRINFFLTFYRFAPDVQQILLLHHLCEVELEEITQIVGQSIEVVTKALGQAQSYLA